MPKTAHSNFARDKRNVVIPSAVEESLIMTASFSIMKTFSWLATGALTGHIFSSLGLTI
jgi:hypothetical protein